MLNSVVTWILSDGILEMRQSDVQVDTLSVFAAEVPQTLIELFLCLQSWMILASLTSYGLPPASPPIFLAFYYYFGAP
jgi:hypothetical protein